ncbi:MAG TPA: adenosylcobinamide-GDP ribazoletransferase [Polyangia bacterium]
MDGSPAHRAPSPATAELPAIGPPPSTPAAVLGGLRAAIMLLSRLPVGRGDLSPAARRWASAWFPLVGAALAATAGVVADLVTPALGSFLAAVLALGVFAALTGALHEDGLADTADALGGARDRAQIFVILKDSRHGTYGVLALALVLLIRLGALDRLQAITTGLTALLLAGLLSRLALTWMLFSLPYVTPAGSARSADVAHGGTGQVVLATALALACLAALGVSAALPWASLVTATVVTLGTATGLGLVFFRRAGGITGDFLGATAQLTEAATLLALVALHPR